MSYSKVLIYTPEGEFVGYAILAPNKLQSTNIWGENDIAKLEKRLAELNNDVDLKRFWPHPQDPEVVQILNDPAFFPIEYVEVQGVDDDLSTYVWEQVPALDEYGNQLGYQDKYGNKVGQWVNGEYIDEAASHLVYKTSKVPKNPSDLMVRIKAASEVVAKRRAEAAQT